MISRPDTNTATMTAPVLRSGAFEHGEYRRLPALVLINGLADQQESWFCNRQYWSRHFDISAPAILVYDGEPIQRRLAEKQPISVEYLTDTLDYYLDNFVQYPPYHLVSSSLGCQIAVEYAARRPEKVDRLVLFCPSGVAPEEKLPVTEGARTRDFFRLVASVFFDKRCVRTGLVRHYEEQFTRKAWRKGGFRTVQDTRENSIRDKLAQVQCPTLVVCGREDRIVDPFHVMQLIEPLPNYTFHLLPNCGHAPQVECADLVNEMVVQFLSEGRHL